jgi:hypothetical protein
MLRLLRTLFGRQEEPVPRQPNAASPPRWREAPTRSWRTDVGGGIVAAMTYPTGHTGFVAVVGESHYQDELRALARQQAPDGIFTARLVVEPDNPHDVNAVAVVAESDGSKVGYLSREVATSYHARLARFGASVTCPARLTGVDGAMLGVVLDFEVVRVALGMERVSIDHGEMDYDAAAEYHRLNNANRSFVKETRPLEGTDMNEAVVRYRRALVALAECREFARTKGLEAFGFALNQTDATPMDRLATCLIKMGKADEAATALNAFFDEFPHAREMTLLKATRKRIERARS